MIQLYLEIVFIRIKKGARRGKKCYVRTMMSNKVDKTLKESMECGVPTSRETGS
jgi:hypothetical protein